MAQHMSFMTAALNGEAVHPKMMVPGQVDFEELERKRTEAAERSMDRKAKKD